MRRRTRLLEIRRLGRRRQRTRRVERHCWHELEHVLRDRPRSARLTHLTQGLGRGHDSMNARVEIHRLLQPFCSCGGSCARCAAAVPDAPNFVSGNDLGQKTSRDVSHFDESRVKEEDVRPVHGYSFCSALPLDRARRTAWCSMFVDVNAKFYDVITELQMCCTDGPYHHNTTGTHFRRGTYPSAYMIRNVLPTARDRHREVES